MQARAAIADLRAGDQRWTVVEAGRRRRTAGALRNVLVDLAVLVGARTEALDRGDDHARVELLDAFPGKSHAVEHARGEVLDQDVAMFNQRLEHLFSFRMFGIERDRALVGVQHSEVETVHAGDIAQLLARDIAHAGALYL